MPKNLASLFLMFSLLITLFSSFAHAMQRVSSRALKESEIRARFLATADKLTKKLAGIAPEDPMQERIKQDMSTLIHATQEKIKQAQTGIINVLHHPLENTIVATHEKWIETEKAASYVITYVIEDLNYNTFSSFTTTETNGICQRSPSVDNNLIAQLKTEISLFKAQELQEEKA